MFARRALRPTRSLTGELGGGYAPDARSSDPAVPAGLPEAACGYGSDQCQWRFVIMNSVITYSERATQRETAKESRRTV